MPESLKVYTVYLESLDRRPGIAMCFRNPV
jgi:hypothetical protein